MKSLIKTIIVLVLFGLLIPSAAPAQEIPGEASVEAVTETIDSAIATPPSKEPVPPPPPPSPPGVASFTSVATVADAFELTEEPPRWANTYVNVAPTAAGRSSSSKVLVIPNTEIKTEDLAAITQDLQVMAHIFHKIFTGPRLIEGLFGDYGDFFGRGSRATEAVYLQGYGVLFLMEVNIPLSSPPKAKETEKDESTQKADSVWQQAKQELLYPTKTVGRPPDSEKIYDADKVEELKSRLIKALKHAANMKNLQPDELIILTVIGKGRSYGGGGYGGGMSEYTDEGAVSVRRDWRTGRSLYSRTRSVPGGIGISAPTVLTIRAKKSDVDAFSKGDLDYDKFREKVQILTYLSLDQQVARGNRIFIYSKPPDLPPESVVPEPPKDAQF